ncbi:DUF3618 domain-containing protein [Plantactinospora sp. CA-294935]|uniref:DUF3618 domain-containing protein n=1 Tax=Plantactinospora sp. CA-294935 TaxID=3240012 RepID=UPI003D8E312F
MSTSTGKSGRTRTTATGVTAVPPTDDPDLIRADIAQTRAELGDTVEHLAARADVKTRAKEKVAEVRGQAGQVKDRATDTAQVAVVRAKDAAQVTAVRAREATRRSVGKARQRPAPYVGVLAGLATALAAVLLVRRRRASKPGARLRRWRSR